MKHSCMTSSVATGTFPLYIVGTLLCIRFLEIESILCKSKAIARVYIAHRPFPFEKGYLHYHNFLIIVHGQGKSLEVINSAFCKS